MDSDYDGFIARVHSKGSFPLMSQDSFEIKAGQVNYVALTATSVYAQDGLSDLDVKARKCKLKTETDNITYFRDYNYFNCLLDCSIKGAREKVSLVKILVAIIFRRGSELRFCGAATS